MCLDLGITPEVDRLIRQQARGLTLRKVDQQRATKLVNDLRDKLLDFLKDNTEQPFFRAATVLTSGSYYEMVKINTPNEFDMMLILPAPQLSWTELDKHQGLFYTVSLSRPTRLHEIRSFLLEEPPGLTISARRILSEMHRLVCKLIKTYTVPDGDGYWEVCRRRVSSPAVTLEFRGSEGGAEEISVDIVPALEVSSKQGWPIPARAGPNIDKWLGKNVRHKLTRQPCYFIPKRPKSRHLSDAAKECWRISFSHIEKEIIRNHGNTKTCCEGKENKCCRKKCLQLLKCLIERLKWRYERELEPLCSYHGKTAFFHALSSHAHDSLWANGNISVRFMQLLQAFEGHAQSRLLPHFFVPDYNLFCPEVFPQKSLLFLARVLREQRVQGLPLFQPSPLAVPPSTCVTGNATVTPVHGTREVMRIFLAVAFVCVCLSLYFRHQ
uniref:Cyclic GMP-AMP synthase n=1 Tax=Denticeps clupeoides TaxID=299321 RepID=A0AAY4CD66_9TELE